MSSLLFLCLFIESRVPGVLMFTTGTNCIPPMGFYKPSLITILQNSSVFPNANTCPMELELPSGVDTYEKFERNMDIAINFQKEGFGII
jgi:hypothetical protein